MPISTYDTMSGSRYIMNHDTMKFTRVRVSDDGVHQGVLQHAPRGIWQSFVSCNMELNGSLMIKLDEVGHYIETSRVERIDGEPVDDTPREALELVLGAMLKAFQG